VSEPFEPTTPQPVAMPEPVQVPAPVVKPVKRQGRSGSVLLAVAGLVAVAGIAFAAGRLTAPAAAAGSTGTNGGGRFGGFPGGSFAPGGFPGGSFAPGGFRGGGPGAGNFAGGLGGIQLKGQVTAVSETSITVKLEGGTDVTVPLDSGTTYHQATAGSASNVIVGSKVTVQPGTANFQPGASPNPQASGAPGFGQITFGPATDVTVVQP